MSVITATVIFLLFACYIGVQLVKNFQLRQMNTCLKSRDYASVEKMADMPMSRRLLGQYTCDLYKLRAMYLDKDVPRFEEMLQYMIAAEYKNPADKKSFLEQYYHTFLLKENRKYADWLLDAIRKTGDEPFILYNEQAYEVMINKRSDLIETMDAQIDSKKYYGFSLGVILFMIARQYEYIHDTKHAIISYKNAKVCFSPKALYIPAIEKSLGRLKQPDGGEQGVRA